jgi:hypothetical protein
LSEGASLFHKTYNLGRVDPAIEDKNVGKKPSHSSTDTYHMINALAKNLQKGVIQQVKFVKIRPSTEGWRRFSAGI